MRLIKQLLCGLLLVGLLATGGHCNEWRDLNTNIEKSGLSTPMHIGAGMIGSALTYHYLPDDMNPWLRKGIAFMAPVVVGTVKEMTDVNFDAKDIGGYAVGAGISITIISIPF